MARTSSFRMGEVAALLGASPDTVRRLADAGKLKTKRTAAGHRVVDGAELARFLVANLESPEADVVVAQSARNRFPGHRHPRHQGQGRGAGRDPRRAASHRLADDPRGGRRARARPGHARDRRRQSHQRRDRSSRSEAKGYTMIGRRLTAFFLSALLADVGVAGSSPPRTTSSTCCSGRASSAPTRRSGCGARSAAARATRRARRHAARARAC